MKNKTLSDCNKTNASEILSDLKTIMGDFYVAMLDLNGVGLNLKLANGQTFLITVKEN